MKKNLFFTILGMGAIVLFSISCSKSDTLPPSVTTLAGNWEGYQSNGFGGPLNYFAISFQANGTLVVSANSPTSPDLANGNWTLVTDSVRASFTYTVSALSYTLVGKYTSGTNSISGTLGSGTSTTGAGVFSLTKK